MRGRDRKDRLPACGATPPSPENHLPQLSPLHWLGLAASSAPCCKAWGPDLGELVSEPGPQTGHFSHHSDRRSYA